MSSRLASRIVETIDTVNVLVVYTNLPILSRVPKYPILLPFRVLYHYFRWILLL